MTEGTTTTTTEYTLHGKLITHLTKRVVNGQNVETGREELHFFYDSQSRPAFVEYDGAMYRYVHNLQGDIVAILDDTGNAVVEYKYDAWGKLLLVSGSMSTSIGAANPYLYRGYVCDLETELYYLKSRYYCSDRNRFINIDNRFGKLGVLLSQSVCCYCNNNPINLIDSDGREGESIFYWGDGANSERYSVEIAIYVPEDEDIANHQIGHFEISLKVGEVWRTYSYGPERVQDIRNGAETSPGRITVRKDRGEWSAKYPCNVYFIRADFPEYNIRYAISHIENMIDKRVGQNGHIGTGKYTVQEGPFVLYSLSKELGTVCRDFSEFILNIIGVLALSGDSGYYPKEFIDGYIGNN